MRGAMTGPGFRRFDSLVGPVAPRLRYKLVGLLAGVDIAWRPFASMQIRLLDADVFAVLLSIFVASGVDQSTVSHLFGLVLYGYLLYVLIPKVFPGRVRHVTQRSGFRLLAAGSVLFVPWHFLLGSSSATSASPWIARTLLLLPLILFGYIVVVQRRALLERDSFVIAFTNAFIPEVDLQQGYDTDPIVVGRTPRFWALFALFSLVTMAMTYAVILILGGMFLLFFLMYPVPEFLLLGWVGYRHLITRAHQPHSEGPSGPAFDLEQRVLTLAGVATHGLKGLTSVLLATFGLLLPVIFLNITVQLTVGVAELLPRGGTMGTATWWAILASTLSVVTVAVYGLYGVWYWLRLLSRVPHFHEAWLTSLEVDIETPTNRTYGSLLSRPPGWFIPPTLLVVTLAVMSTLDGWLTEPRIPATHLVAWGAFLGLTLWSTYRAWVDDPQPAITDGLALPASFIVQVIGISVFVDISSGDQLILRALAGDIPVYQPLVETIQSATGSAPVLITITVLYAYLASDVIDWHGSHGWQRFTYVPYFVAAAVPFGLLGLSSTGPAALGSTLMALVLVSMLVALGLRDLSLI